MVTYNTSLFILFAILPLISLEETAIRLFFIAKLRLWKLRDEIWHTFQLFTAVTPKVLGLTSTNKIDLHTEPYMAASRWNSGRLW